jgi:hypothetical protein
MVAALCVNVGVNFALLPEIGWRAAVWATYSSEVVQIVLLATIARNSRRGAESTDELSRDAVLL